MVYCASYITILILGLSFITLCLGHGNSAKKKVNLFDDIDCNRVTGFSTELRDEIRSKAGDVQRIIDLVLNGKEHHSTYEELAYFCDTFGPRMSGSKSLSDAINYMATKMKESKLKVHLEGAMIPHWTVGKQYAELTSPVKHPMSILALGYSVGTNGTIEAEVVVVHSFQELDELGRAGKLKDKIVVYNYRFTTYGESVKFRSSGAMRASKYGASAALVRSVTPFSINSPHAGAGSKSIPTAAITTEDADLIERWHKRGKKLVIKLFIEATNEEDVLSHNIIGDIEGTSKPDEIVLVSGHLDSWYNTQGAMDDGGGMMISYKALDVLNKLNLKAKRTIRAMLWTSEEFGLVGAQKYFDDHKHELNKFKLVMESDLGTFKPQGLSFVNMKPLGQCIVNETLSLLSQIGTTRLDSNFEGSDIEVFTDAGVPGLSLMNENSKYFFYHHTSGDTISLEDPDYLDMSTILWAASSYVMASLDVDF